MIVIGGPRTGKSIVIDYITFANYNSEIIRVGTTVTDALSNGETTYF